MMSVVSVGDACSHMISGLNRNNHHTSGDTEGEAPADAIRERTRDEAADRQEQVPDLGCGEDLGASKAEGTLDENRHVDDLEVDTDSPQHG
ncbi:hypothetical protein [Shinella sp.]|uniref:hypothetical protein n=1 Tax=Shinella sp. TaxID=1870904 RepID=UPI003F72EE63